MFILRLKYNGRIYEKVADSFELVLESLKSELGFINENNFRIASVIRLS